MRRILAEAALSEGGISLLFILPAVVIFFALSALPPI
jgi:hypothetical protein